MNPLSDRIATVKETGKRYIINRINFNTDMVYCYGELVSFKGLKRKHAHEKSFPLEAVDIEPARINEALLSNLFDQAIDAAEAGDIPFLIPAASRELARRRRRQKKRIESIMRLATRTGDTAMMVDLIDETLSSRDDVCEGCDKEVATIEFEGLLLCGTCKAEVMA